MRASSDMPFVIGQWVCGPKFYGRRKLLEILQHEGEDWRWIAGLRRIGKTSLLKELDLRASTRDEPFLSLFWDFQGLDHPDELAPSFCDALLDSEEALEQLDISVESVEDARFAVALDKLLEALRVREAGLLLLCDEVEEGAAFEEAHPGFSSELWGRLRDFERARVIAASSIRLQDRAEGEEEVRELLEPFSAPIFLGALEEAEARSLLSQEHLPPLQRPALGEAALESLLAACGHHPMLLQMAGKRCLELEDPEEVLRQMETDRSVQHLLAVDFQLLSPREQGALQEIALGGEPTPSGTERLVCLGVLRREGHAFEIPNRFLAAWLQETR